MLAPRLAVISIAVVAGCATGTPVGFSSGNSWTVPLVGPLENGLLIVPVYIHDTGPYLMAIDPDSVGSVIDDAIVKQLGLPSGPFGHITDETDTQRQVFGAEVRSLRVGTLKVEAQYLWVMKAGTLNVGGRELRGVLGRDVIADSLVFGFDRDRGVAYLTTQKGFTRPASATTIDYGQLSNTTMRLLVSRRMVKAQIGALTADVHLDLGATESQLRQKLWRDAGVTEVAAGFQLRDEAGTIRRVQVGGIADQVVVKDTTAEKIVFAPYDDKRWQDQFIDGTIALDVLRRFTVWANWDEKRFYLVPRGDLVATAKERIGRWQSSVLDGCAALGCATIRTLLPNANAAPPADPQPAPTEPAPTEPAPAPAPTEPAPTEPAPTTTQPAPPAVPRPPGASPIRPRPVLMVERDPAAAELELELVLVALDEQGVPTALPRLIVNLPKGTASVSTQLGPDYAGTRIVVIDAGLFPRPCPRGGGCIDSLAP
jgi:hypothetical protein